MIKETRHSSNLVSRQVMDYERYVCFCVWVCVERCSCCTMRILTRLVFDKGRLSSPPLTGFFLFLMSFRFKQNSVSSGGRLVRFSKPQILFVCNAV